LIECTYGVKLHGYHCVHPKEYMVGDLVIKILLQFAEYGERKMKLAYLSIYL